MRSVIFDVAEFDGPKIRLSVLRRIGRQLALVYEPSWLSMVATFVAALLGGLAFMDYAAYLIMGRGLFH